MTVLDASAIVAALLDEPGRAEVERILRSKEDRPKLSAVNVGEVIDRLTRVAERPLERVEEAIDWLRAGGLVIVPVTEQIGRVAGELRAAYYQRVDAPLSLADCICLATAQNVDDALATTDPALAATARRIGVEVVAIPGSGGARPRRGAMQHASPSSRTRTSQGFGASFRTCSRRSRRHEPT